MTTAMQTAKGSQAPATQQQQPRQLTLRQTLASDTFKNQIALVLPKHMKPDRMARVAITALTTTPLLEKCTIASFMRAMMQLSQWGLEPDGRRAHLIPFRNNKAGTYEVQLIIDYKGLAELVMRSGLVSNIHADVVCDLDEFEYNRGVLVCHKINYRKPRGPIYAGYCLVRLKDGSEKCDVMHMDEVQAIRKRSRAGSSGPWVTDFNEMAKKTIFRRLSKWLPLSAEIRDATENDDDVIDVESKPATPAISMEEATKRLGLGVHAEESDGLSPGEAVDADGEIQSGDADDINQDTAGDDANQAAPAIDWGTLNAELAAATTRAHVTKIRERYKSQATSEDDAANVDYSCDTAIKTLDEKRSGKGELLGRNAGTGQ